MMRFPAKARGFQTLFFDPYLANGADKAVGIASTKSLDELLGKADVLSIHCPLNEETRHLIAERELALMKPSAFVVNDAEVNMSKAANRIDHPNPLRAFSNQSSRHNRFQMQSLVV